MNFHLCTESPCETKDKESVALFQCGFKTTYMQEDNEKHMAICEKCRVPGIPYRSWLCVHCDKVGYGFGCPSHAHEEDGSVVV